MNKLLSVAVIIILPAGGLFSSLYVFLFYLFLKIFSCSEQSAVGLLVRVASQSLGIAAVCSALCSLKFQPKPVGKKHPHMSVSPLPARFPGNSGAPVGGGSWPQKSPHPV